MCSKLLEAITLADEQKFSLADLDLEMLERIANGIDNPAESLSKIEELPNVKSDKKSSDDKSEATAD